MALDIFQIIQLKIMIKTMKNIWSIICSRAVVDSNTNSLSLFDCVEEATVGFPNIEEMNKPKKAIPASFTVVSLWINEDSSKEKKFNQLIEIYDPSNKKLKDFFHDPRFEKNKKRLRTLVQINGMEITGEGQYTIIIKYKESGEKYLVAAELPLDIKFVLNIPLKKISK